MSPRLKESIEQLSHNSSVQNAPDENWLKLYNPKNNTINLARLTQALQYQTPSKSGVQSPYGRNQNTSTAEELTLNEILSKTLQKLKRRPTKGPGKLQPLTVN